MPCRRSWFEPTPTPFEVVKKTDDYEVRQYGPQVRATTAPEGGRRAFRSLAGYLFQESAPVLAGDELPVTHTTESTPAPTDPTRSSGRWCSSRANRTSAGGGVGVALPVVIQGSGAGRSWYFVLPSLKATPADLPARLPQDVRLVEVPEKQYAVQGFSWWPRDGYIKQQEQALREAAARDGLKLSPKAEDVEVWLYSRPWTMPWSRRNEVAIPITGRV